MAADNPRRLWNRLFARPRSAVPAGRTVRVAARGVASTRCRCWSPRGHGDLRDAVPARRRLRLAARARPGRRCWHRLRADRADHIPARAAARDRAWGLLAAHAAVRGFRAGGVADLAGICSQVARRPVATAVIVLVLLGAACAGLASLSIDNNPITNGKTPREPRALPAPSSIGVELWISPARRAETRR